MKRADFNSHNGKKGFADVARTTTNSSMADIFISAEDLGKRYEIPHLARKPCDSVREAIASRASQLGSRMTGGGATEPKNAATVEEYSVLMPGSLRPSLPWTVEMVGSPEIAAR